MTLRTPWGRPCGQRGEEGERPYREVGARVHGRMAPGEGALRVSQPRTPVLSVLLCGRRTKGVSGRVWHPRRAAWIHAPSLHPELPSTTPAGVGAGSEGSPSSLCLPPDSRLTVARMTARAGESPGCPRTRPAGPERTAGAHARTSTARAAGRWTRVPFSTLREQGSSKMFLTLGQAACVFQVLAKAAAVPSTTPLRARRSSAWFWLKFPQRPGPGVGVA